MGKFRISFVFPFASDTALSGHLGSPEVKKLLQMPTFSFWVKQSLGTDHVVTKSNSNSDNRFLYQDDLEDWR